MFILKRRGISKAKRIHLREVGGGGGGVKPSMEEYRSFPPLEIPLLSELTG